MLQLITTEAQQSQHQVLTGPTTYSALIALCNRANYRIRACIYLWHWDCAGIRQTDNTSLQGALQAAARRRCTIEIMLPMYSSTQVIGHVNRAAAINLMQLGATVRVSPMQSLAHAKAWLIDTSEAMLGSHNISRAAMEGNRDISIITSAADIVGPLADILARWWRSSDPIRPDDLRKGGRWCPK